MMIVSLGPTLVPEDFLSACEGKANRFFDLLRDRLVLRLVPPSVSQPTGKLTQ